jgi:hypothetical protein
MVAVCIVSKKGKLIKIKEVPDKYRYIPFKWDEDNN